MPDKHEKIVSSVTNMSAQSDEGLVVLRVDTK